MSELKPCPFCGNEDNLKRYDNGFDYYWIECGDCGCCTEGKEGSEGNGIKNWNTRADSERIKELEEALMDVIDGYPAYDLVYRTGLSLDRCQEIWRIAKVSND